MAELKDLLEQLNTKNLSTEKVDEIVKQAEQFKDTEGYSSFIAFAEAKKKNKDITYDEYSAQSDKTAEKSPAREGFQVGGEEKPDWLKEKEEFWKTYAQENKYGVKTEIKDNTFSAELSDGDKAYGSIKYTSPSAATISQDASIELYQGLVKDAMSNELSVTFGNSLDDKQKAMLMAACLMNKDKYKDGSNLEMVNPPKIDMNAEYFKELPENVQKILKEHIEKETQQTNQPLDIEQLKKNFHEESKKKFKTDDNGKFITHKTNDGKTVHELTDDYKNMTPEQQKELNDKLKGMAKEITSKQAMLTEEQKFEKIKSALEKDNKSDRLMTAEKILAARMGIAPATVGDKEYQADTKAQDRLKSQVGEKNFNAVQSILKQRNGQQK